MTKCRAWLTGEAMERQAGDRFNFNGRTLSDYVKLGGGYLLVSTKAIPDQLVTHDIGFGRIPMWYDS